MANSFEQLGIAPELAAGAANVGWQQPAAIQRDAVPIIRRGNNAVLHASPGAAATGAFCLGILDRLLTSPDGQGPLRALVIVPDASTASDIARTFASLGAETDLAIRALAPGWPPRSTDVLVAAPDDAVAAIRDSSLKVDGVLTLVVHGAERILATDQWEAVETIAEAAPPGAQRILVTARLDPAIVSFIERHVRKAMTIPARSVDSTDVASGSANAIGYRICAESEKTAAAVDLIASTEAPEVAIVCRTADRAESLSAELAARGLGSATQAQPSEPQSRPKILAVSRTDADRRSTRAEVISYDVPFDAEGLADLHSRGGTVLVTPGQLIHLKLIATRSGVMLRPVSGRPHPLGLAERVRARLRETLESADLAADLALIEPLLRDFSAPELAAAALHLARVAGVTTAGEGTSQVRTHVHTGAAVSGGRSATPAAPPPGESWVRLFISAGTRDGLGPGDLVGAISGETDLEGAQVGKIDVRESHSTVEVPAQAAAAVIQALNGRSLRGRSLRVDYDRKERTPRPPTSRGGPGGPGGSRGSGPRGTGGSRGGTGPRGGGPRGGSGPRKGGSGPRPRPGGASPSGGSRRRGE
jgi:ATP-dependent RNA helicase DeaD